MASSSDWIAQAKIHPTETPAWLTALGAEEGFVEGAPFRAATPSATIITEPELPPEPDEPDALALAFAKGEEQGRIAALAEAEAAQSRQRALRLAFRTFDQAAMDALASEIADTVVALCEQVLGENAVNRDDIMRRCAAAAERLGTGANQCTLRLHPDDVDMIGEEALAEWTIARDSSLEPGSLVLVGPDGAVRDGPAEWRRAIALAVRG